MHVMYMKCMGDCEFSCHQFLYFYCLPCATTLYPQDNLLRTKPMKWTSGRFRLTSCPRSACILPTRSVTPTAPQKYPNSPSLRRLRWNCSWLLTFWIAKVTEIMWTLKPFFFFFEYLTCFAICFIWHSFHHLLFFFVCFLLFALCFLSYPWNLKKKRMKRVIWKWQAKNGVIAPSSTDIFPHLSMLIKTYLVSTLFPAFYSKGNCVWLKFHIDNKHFQYCNSKRKLSC